MRSKEAFAYSRRTGYFCSVAALPTTANKEKAPAARPGLGWDLTDRTIIRAVSLHNSAIFENRCIFWTTDGVICALGYNESV